MNCPFCGGEPIMKVSGSLEHSARKVECGTCGVMTGWETQLVELTRTWNKRSMAKRDLLAIIPSCKSCDSWSDREAWVNKKKYCSANQAYFKAGGFCSDHTDFDEEKKC